MNLFSTPLDLLTFFKLLSSIVALLLMFAVRSVLARVLRHLVTTPELRRRWTASIRNALFVLFALALVSIWAETIQTFTVSIIAVAVALVIATKELSMCLLGSIVRLAGDSYAIGDRVAIGTHHGDVVDHNVLTTMLLELGSDAASQQHTGRTITLPNSILLTTPVTKESTNTPYSLHVFVVPVGRDANLDRDIRTLLEAANDACAPFLDDVRRHWKRLAAAHDVQESSPEPHVTLALAAAGHVDLTVQIPSPIGRQTELQEAILQQFLGVQSTDQADVATQHQPTQV